MPPYGLNHTTPGTNGTNGTSGYWTEQTTCTEEKKVSFMTVNNFKQNNYYDATYEITVTYGSVVTNGTFAFKPHWRETAVSVDVGTQTGELTVIVTNQFTHQRFLTSVKN